jgi:ATP-dependent exoDNAse (exonuclease V) beta subunit (contains helicase and exonuclease domains)
MILASAGSGKTYALTNRFVQLLAGGAAPERIVALTFTRKAAGEFFDEILKNWRGRRRPRTMRGRWRGKWARRDWARRIFCGCCARRWRRCRG